MAGKLKGITVEIGGDVTKLGDSLKQAEDAARDAGSELKGVNSILSRIDPGNVTMLAQKGELLDQRVGSLADKLKTLREAQEKVGSAPGLATQEQLAGLRDLEREIVTTQAALQRARAAQESFASGADAVRAAGAHWEAQGTGAVDAAKKVYGLSAALIGVAKESVDASIEFESSFAGVRKTVDATEEEFSKLSEASRRMALEKPVDVNDVNLVMELGGQLGIAKDSLADFAGVVSDLDVATDLDVETASTDMAQFANITGMAQSDFDRFGSTIVDLGNHSATTESKIVAMAMRIAGAGTSVGMTQSDILGLSAALSSVGIEAEAGGSAISTIISNIDKQVATNGEGLQTWAQTAGMSAEAFAAAWRDDPVSALNAVIGGMSDTVDEGGNLALLLDDLGVTELRQTDTLKRLANAHGLVGQSVATASAAWEENTALANEASQRYATTESQIELLKNRIKDAAISIGDGLKPALAGIMEPIAAVAEGAAGAAKAFSELPEPVRNVAVAGAAMTAGLAPLLAASGKLTQWAGSFSTALGRLAQATITERVAIEAGTAATGKNAAAGILATVKKSASVAVTQLAATQEAKLTAAKAAGTVASAAQATATATSTAATVAQAAATGRLNVAQKALTAATTVARAAQEGLNMAWKANPIGVAMAGVGLAVGSLTALYSAVKKATDGSDELTEASRRQQQAVDDARSAYDDAVRLHGEMSDEAGRAKASLDEETVSFEASRQTVGEFRESVEGAVSSHADLMDSISRSYSSASASAGAMQNLADRVVDLASTEGRSAEQRAQLKALTDQLNASCEGLNLSYDEQTDKLSMSADAIRQYVDAAASSTKADAAMSSYNDLVKEQVELEGKLQTAKDGLSAAQGRVNEVQGQYATVTPLVADIMNRQALSLGKAKDEASKYEQSVSDLSSALDENRQQQEAALRTAAEFGTRQDALARAVADVEAGTLTAADAAQRYSEVLGVSVSEQEVAAQVAADQAEQEAQHAQALSEAAQAVQDYAAAHAGFAVALYESGYTAETFAQRLDEAGVSMDDFGKSVDEMADKASDGFSRISEDSMVSLDEYVANLQANQAIIAGMNDNISQLMARAGSESERQFVQMLAQAGPDAAGVLYDLANSDDETFQYVADSWAQGGTAAEQGYVDALYGGVDGAQQAGDAAGAGFSDSVEAQLAQCPGEVQQYVAQLQAQLDAGTPSAEASGQATGSGYTGSLAAAISSAPAEVQQYISQLEAQCNDLVAPASQSGSDAGTGLGSGMASGVASYTEPVRQASSGLASAAEAMKDNNDNASTWGSHLGENFASGIRGAWDSVVGAASSLASAVAGFLKHSVPAEGPLSDDDVWGAHLGQNLASGMMGEVPSVAMAARSLARAAVVDLRDPSVPSVALPSYSRAGAASAGGQSQSVTYNVYFDGVRVNDRSDVRSATKSYLEELHSLGVM